MIANFVAETTNAPGTGATVTLLGAVADRRAFAQSFANAAFVWYFMDDGTQSEAGYATFTTGTPNRLTARTPVWDSVNGDVSPTARNFTGLTTVYNEVPAERLVYLGAGGTASTTTGSFTGNFAANGWRKLPNGDIEQWGSAATGTGGTVNVVWPAAFPYNAFNVTATIISPGLTQAVVVTSAPTLTGGTFIVCNSATGAAVNAAYIFYRAIGN